MPWRDFKFLRAFLALEFHFSALSNSREESSGEAEPGFGRKAWPQRLIGLGSLGPRQCTALGWGKRETLDTRSSA